jgi:hypothetical protein
MAGAATSSVHERRTAVQLTRVSHLSRPKRLLAFGLAVLVLGATNSRAQVNDPYDYFRTLTVEEKASFQLKISFVGAQTKAHQSFVIHSVNEVPDPILFEEFQHPGIRYANDAKFVDVSVSSGEIDSLIGGIGELDGVTDPDSGTGVFMSIALLARLPVKRGFEAIINREEANALFDKIRTALHDNAEASRLIAKQACMHDLLEIARPQDVTNSVDVVFSGVRRDADSKTFIGSARIRNESTSLILSPVSLVLLDLPYEIEILNATGLTCGTSPYGKPYVNIGSASNGIAAGQEVSVTVEFANEYLIPFGGCHCENDPGEYCVVGGAHCDAPNQCICTPSSKVLSGPGAR